MSVLFSLYGVGLSDVNAWTDARWPGRKNKPAAREEDREIQVAVSGTPTLAGPPGKPADEVSRGDDAAANDVGLNAAARQANGALWPAIQDKPATREVAEIKAPVPALSMASGISTAGSSSSTPSIRPRCVPPVAVPQGTPAGEVRRGQEAAAAPCSHRPPPRTHTELYDWGVTTIHMLVSEMENAMDEPLEHRESRSKHSSFLKSGDRSRARQQIESNRHYSSSDAADREEVDPRWTSAALVTLIASDPRCYADVLFAF